MDIHHDASLRSILEDDSISLASKACIHFCSSKGVGLWLVVRPSICLFPITHFTFTLALCLRLGLIRPSTSSLFTCECGHGLDAFNTHLIHCSFGGQQISTHDAIWDIMYAFSWNNGHNVWKEQLYTLTWKVSLRAELHITWED
jgi:hypothetical protein